MRLAALRRVLQKRGRDPKPPGPDFLSYHRAGRSPSSCLRTHQNLLGGTRCKAGCPGKGWFFMGFGLAKWGTFQSVFLNEVQAILTLSGYMWQPSAMTLWVLRGFFCLDILPSPAGYSLKCGVRTAFHSQSEMRLGTYSGKSSFSSLWGEKLFLWKLILLGDIRIIVLSCRITVHERAVIMRLQPNISWGLFWFQKTNYCSNSPVLWVWNEVMNYKYHKDPVAHWLYGLEIRSILYIYHILP